MVHYWEAYSDDDLDDVLELLYEESYKRLAIQIIEFANIYYKQ